VENFAGINGDGTMNLHGFDIRHEENKNILHILLINHRPPIDPDNGQQLDATSIGANSTIEHFRTEVGSDSMTYVKTIADPLIQTPNRVAWATDDSFVFTNDHSAKVGFVSSLF
jgi:arylesterase / paraoxonase